MGRHRTPTAVSLDQRRERFADGETVLVPGFDQAWAASSPTQIPVAGERMSLFRGARVWSSDVGTPVLRPSRLARACARTGAKRISRVDKR